jgi:hypothetical protein
MTKLTAKQAELCEPASTSPTPNTAEWEASRRLATTNGPVVAGSSQVARSGVTPGSSI